MRLSLLGFFLIACSNSVIGEPIPSEPICGGIEMQEQQHVAGERYLVTVRVNVGDQLEAKVIGGTLISTTSRDQRRTWIFEIDVPAGGTANVTINGRCSSTIVMIDNDVTDAAIDAPNDAVANDASKDASVDASKDASGD